MKALRTRVKICGITSPEDATAAVRAGADAIGVVLADSPRQVSLERAEDVFGEVPPFVVRVGVFVDEDPGFVREAVARLGLGLVQFHGDEDPQACGCAPSPVVKAFKVAQDFDPALLTQYRGKVAAVLLDTYVPGTNGGTGKTFAWENLPELPSWAPLIVAGGLSTINVGACVRALRPYAVDVSTGVEEHPRAKDELKMRAFVSAVRSADEDPA